MAFTFFFEKIKDNYQENKKNTENTQAAENIEKFNFNKAVANIYEFLNSLQKHIANNSASKEDLGGVCANLLLFYSHLFLTLVKKFGVIQEKMAQ